MNEDHQKPDIESLAQTVPGIIYRVDLRFKPHGKIVFINNKVEDLTGYSVDDFISAKINWFDLIIQENQSNPNLHYPTKPFHKNNPYKVEYKIKHKTDGYRWVLHHGYITFQDNLPFWNDGVIMDITSQKKAEQVQRLNEEILLWTSEISKTGGWELNLEEMTVRWTDEVYKIREAEKLNTKPTLEEALNYYNESDRPMVKEAVNSALAKGIPWDFKVPFTTLKGRKIWVRDIGIPKMENGKCVSLRGVLQDITDEKAHELMLENVNKELDQFKIAINTASIVTIADTQGRIKHINQNFLDITGYAKEEIIGQKHNVINSGYHPRSFWQNMWRTVSAGKVWRAEVCNRSKSGNLYWVDTFIIPIMNNNQEVTEYISIRNEITQKKKDEERIKLLSMVTSHTNNYVIITDRKGKIEWVNESFEKSTGYALTEILGLRPGDFLQGEGTSLSVKKYMSEMIKQGKPFECEILNYSKTQEKYWVKVTAQPLMDNRGNVIQYFSIMYNITEQKKLMDELENATQRAVASDRLKSSFLANISHELRTPMNAIMGFADLLDRPNLADEKRIEFINIIKQRGHHLLNVFNNILNMSIIEEGKIIPVAIRVNLKEVYNDIKLSMETELNYLIKNEIELIFYNNIKEEKQDCKIDVLKLKQVVKALIINAAKFTKEGFIELKCELIHKDSTLLFTVSDSGIGIAKEKLESIFKPFHQGDENIHLQYGGSGLGLAICKGLVELMGGQIWADSELGKGSKFFFTIPYVPV